MSDVTEHDAARPTNHEPVPSLGMEPAPAPAAPSLEEIVAAVLAHIPAPAPAPAAKVSDEHASLLAEAAPMLAQLTALQAKAETEGHTIVSLLESVGRQILGIFR
jgi:hypothetical protein